MSSKIKISGVIPPSEYTILPSFVLNSFTFFIVSEELYGFCIHLPDGVKYLATVILNAPPSRKLICSPTRPFPKLFFPTIIPLS